ncbi:hypothetical protein CB0940_02922 [Cercospora beticola]|uniref:Xylanolytic transcriptional activator regulatory domain-containing protein n=1 Tax=Cercospora beticola TaxID=122368 RepID=A0A2G5I5Q9_CERBT|nr:hypothetical protein CB0940_02922 [Cercospora beticola]PIB00131.1 hypothetical protein CB0940_02922 [Cercospora beticola]WPB00075.1 hypothetical protein RHO25_004694 [Cercospora beticola]
MNYAASTLSATVRKFSLHEDQESTGNINLLAEAVIHSTSAKLNIQPDQDYRTFVEMFTGDNLRLEMLGLIYTIAARAHGKSMPIEVEQDDELLHALFKAAQSCLYLARELAPSVNDVMIWLSFELTRLYTNAQGDSHPNVWRSLGDLTSDVYILGIHRESKAASGTPFWLAECRRKSWAVIYQWDKFGAKLFNRPPRLNYLYSDCALPANLSDHELLGDPVTLQEARSKLTANGWNPDGLYCSTTWCRMRYMASVIQEKIIAYEYQTVTPDSTRELLVLYDQLNAFWDSVPDKLRYTPEVWYTKVHPKECLMLAVVYLLHLQSSFRIHRKLMSSDALHAKKALEVASLIVNTVNHLSQVRDRSIFLRFDNSYVMLDYGLSAAATMIEAISNKGAQNWHGIISRSKLVRDLSVFVASLEGICQPGEANHAVCTRAARRIAKALDEVLDSGTTTKEDERSNQIAQTAATGTLVDTTAAIQQTVETSGCDLIVGEQNGFDELDYSDLDSWLRSIDWTGVGADYTF